MYSRRTAVPNHTHFLPLELNVMPPPCWMPHRALEPPQRLFQFFREHRVEKSTYRPDHDFRPYNLLLSTVISVSHRHFVIHFLIIPFCRLHSSRKAGMILEFIFPPQFLPVCLNLRLTDIKGVPIGIKLCRKGVPVAWNIRTASLDRFLKKSD